MNIYVYYYVLLKIYYIFNTKKDLVYIKNKGTYLFTYLTKIIKMLIALSFRIK
jgi:hypothetical protein